MQEQMQGEQKAAAVTSTKAVAVQQQANCTATDDAMGVHDNLDEVVEEEEGVVVEHAKTSDNHLDLLLPTPAH